MSEFLIILIFALLLAVFIYFGYHQDYKRNPKEFTRNSIAMPIGLLANFLGLTAINEKLKKWANNSGSKKKYSTTMISPLCNARLSNKKDPYYYDCGTCKALVKSNKHYITADEEKARYEAHNNDVDDIRYQNFVSPITKYVFENFSPTHKGLDFGCGTGPVISSVLMKKNYTILQYDPFFAPHEDVLHQKFDYVVSCEVFEHFHHPNIEIDRLSTILKPNGVLLIMTLLYNDKTDFNTWHYRKDPTHVFIYRKETFDYIATKKNLNVELFTDRFVVLRKADKK